MFAGDRAHGRGTRPARPSLGSQDVGGALPTHEVQAALRLGDLGTRHWHVTGCSAATGDGLAAAFGWLVADVASRIYTLE